MITTQDLRRSTEHNTDRKKESQQRRAWIVDVMDDTAK